MTNEHFKTDSSTASARRAYDGVYEGDSLSRISFPVGGMGSGCIGIAGNGALIDWEIFNRPNQGSRMGFAHIAVRAERDGKVLDARLLQMSAAVDDGTDTLSSYPRFESLRFIGRYPFATLEFRDPRFPGVIRLTAYNPFIPGNDRDSSIPAAFFECEIENTTGVEIDYTAAFTAQNPFSTARGANVYGNENDISRISFVHSDAPVDICDCGDMCLATDAPRASHVECWKRVRRGQDHEISAKFFWRDLLAGGLLKDRPFVKPEPGIEYPSNDHATLAAHVSAAPGECATARFVLSWSFPWRRNYWRSNLTFVRRDYHDIDPETPWRNYYATLFDDSAKSAGYALAHWRRLTDDSRLFASALWDSTLPPVFIEAISANLAILKSPTVMRLDDGSLYGFEGSGKTSGSWEGSSSHVWQYAYSLPFLFPDVERSMRDIEIKYTLRPDGGLLGRVMLPLGCGEYNFRPCVDGQFATVLKIYRDWKISGDTDWLKGNWDSVKSMISFAWAETNVDLWDPERDGVIDGRQHSTYDAELFGPSGYLNSFYLSALKAGQAMAAALGDSSSSEIYGRLLETGTRWTEDHLFNGDYYIQKLNIHDAEILLRFPHSSIDTSWYDERDAVGIYWDDEAMEIKEQIGEGCFADQLASQWHCCNVGIEPPLRRDRIRTTLESIYRNNFATREQVFEKHLDRKVGTMLCTWPDHVYRPLLHIRYAEATWPGIGYAFAAMLVREGWLAKAEAVVTGIREFFDGEHRNPWDEPEAGRYYTRSMSSYSLLLAMSGFEYDGTIGMIGFNPQSTGESFRCLWSLKDAWGVVLFEKSSVILSVLRGELDLASFRSAFLEEHAVISVKCGSAEIPFSMEDRTLVFPRKVRVKAGHELSVELGKYL